MQIKITISEVDYIGISEAALPKLLQRLSDRPEAGRFLPLLSRFQHLPGKVAVAVLKAMPQQTRDGLALWLLKANEPRVLELCNRLFAEKGLPLLSDSVSFSGTASSLEAVILFADVDYAAVLLATYPLLAERFAGHEKIGKLLGLIELLGDSSEKVLRAALSALSEQEIGELISSTVGAYEEDICALLSHTAEENGIRLTIAGVDVLCAN